METTQHKKEPIIVPGPAGFHPPSAAQLGVSLPDPGQGLMYGLLEPNDEEVMKEMARKMLTSDNPTLFPGPMILWAWNERGRKGQGGVEDRGADSEPPDHPDA